MNGLPPSRRNDSAPRVTVLSAVYRDAPFVRAAVDSVLAQTFTDFEYLIINDCAVDESREIVASYGDPRIRLVDNPTNLGLTRSLNRGLALARGELIARFDSNDICFPERLAKQVAYLDAHPDVAAVGVQALLIDVHGRRIRRAPRRRPTSDAAIHWCSVFSTPLIHEGTMFRRGVVRDELGGYNEEFRVAQDTELWFRILRRHRIANLDEVLMAVRSDPRSISGDLSAPVREGHVARWIPLIAARASELLGMDVPLEWSRLYVELFHPASELTAADLLQVMLALETWHARFIERRPEAADDAEVRSHVASVYEQVLFQLARLHSWRAVRAWKKMLPLDGRAAVTALPLAAALMLLGPNAARLWRRLRGEPSPR